MDNQQETSWFVGILEGEGSFRKSYHQGTQIRISNTELDLINLVENFLNNNHILYTINDWKRTNRKREYELSIRDIDTFRKRISPFIECRKEFIQLGSSETTRDPSLTKDLWWLIGLVEAEGSLHICCRMSRKDKINYSPEITIVNTNFRIIEKVTNTLYSLGLSWHVQCYVPNNSDHNAYKVVTIRGWLRVQRALRLFNPLFRTIKYRLKGSLLQEFVDIRLIQDNRKNEYLQRHHEIFRQLKMMI